MKLEDFERPACGCAACVVAGVAEKPQRRDPRTGVWMHGRDLRRWHDARERFLELKKILTPKELR